MTFSRLRKRDVTTIIIVIIVTQSIHSYAYRVPKVW